LSLEKEIAEPNIGRGGACAIYCPGTRCLVATSEIHPGVNWVTLETGGLLEPLLHLVQGEVWGVVPAPGPGDKLHVQGTAAAPVRLTITADDVVLATPKLKAGPFQWSAPMPPAPGKDRLQVMVHGDPIVDTWPPPLSQPKIIASYALSLLQTERAPGARDERRLIAASEVRGQMEWGHPSVLRLHLAERSLVQLPVMYYPGLLRVHHNGRRVPVRHLGRFVALDLPPGDHDIRVRFVGVRWANGVSLAGWVAVALAALGIAAFRLTARKPGQLRRLFQARQARDAMMRWIQAAETVSAPH